MTFKKYLIIASKKDKAGINITTQLSQFRKNPVLSAMNENPAPTFDFLLVDEEIIWDSNYNQEKINKYDFIIFASKHQSEKGGKTLSIHAPGNPRQNDLGGQPNKMCPTSALLQKHMFEKMHKIVEEHELKNYQITLECTHHGPLINKPCLFIEIGSTETEWADRRVAFVIAKTISESIETFQPNPHREIAIGIGGPHYCPSFNKIQKNSNIAISHIIQSYSLPLTEEMIKEAIKKTHEEVDLAILDWKGMGNSEQRQQSLEILNKNYISYKKTSEIEK